MKRIVFLILSLPVLLFTVGCLPNYYMSSGFYPGQVVTVRHVHIVRTYYSQPSEAQGQVENTNQNGNAPPTFIAPIYNSWLTNGLHKKNAVDFHANEGTPVHAAASGQVKWEGWDNGGGGKTIILSHRGGVRTVYCHLSQFMARQGEVVSQGQVIALSGQTGNASAPHLHFGVCGAPNPFAKEWQYAHR